MYLHPNGCIDHPSHSPPHASIARMPRMAPPSTALPPFNPPPFKPPNPLQPHLCHEAPVQLTSWIPAPTRQSIPCLAYCIALPPTAAEPFAAADALPGQSLAISPHRPRTSLWSSPPSLAPPPSMSSMSSPHQASEASPNDLVQQLLSSSSPDEQRQAIGTVTVWMQALVEHKTEYAEGQVSIFCRDGRMRNW